MSSKLTMEARDPTTCDSTLCGATGVDNYPRTSSSMVCLSRADHDEPVVLPNSYAQAFVGAPRGRRQRTQPEKLLQWPAAPLAGNAQELAPEQQAQGSHWLLISG